MYYERNVTYKIEEKMSKNKTKKVTYDDLVREIEMMETLKDESENEDCQSLEEEYANHYNTSDIKKICEYYGLNTTKSKRDMIIDIVVFEKNPDNFSRVYQRKKLWNYMKEIKEDSYLRKYLIFN
jgi:hypothetical protein